MATTPRRYLHDRLVLLLLSFNVFVAVLSIILILLSLANGKTGSSGSVFVEYRANLGISAFRAGRTSDFIGFVVFALVALVLHVYLSRKSYHTRRYYALTILSLGLLLQIVALIVSQALLTL